MTFVLVSGTLYVVPVVLLVSSVKEAFEVCPSAWPSVARMATRNQLNSVCSHSCSNTAIVIRVVKRMKVMSVSSGFSLPRF